MRWPWRRQVDELNRHVERESTQTGGVENSSAQRPEEHLVGLLASNSYVPDMEAAGQQQLVGSSRLPAEGNWDGLGALGFVKGDPVAGDPLFVEATVPVAWVRRSTDHSMHSEIFDDRGLPRVGIFYKAAFYDRSAHFWIIDVGAHVVSSALNKDTGPVEVPSQWDLLTVEEKTSACEHLRGWTADRWSVTSDELWERAKQLCALLCDPNEDKCEAGLQKYANPSVRRTAMRERDFR